MRRSEKLERGLSIRIGVGRVKELGKKPSCLFIKNMSSWMGARSGLPTDEV